MKAISQGDNTYDIFDDSLRVYDKLPAQPYVVRFSERRGFFLQKYVDMEVTEPKVYGVHETKVEKVLSSFGEIDRSLGVILSGSKGIGKSLFAKMLSRAAIEKGYPVIVVDRYVRGIASYIEQIEQEVMILFDEFDKTFGEIRQSDGESHPQTELLSLFDGLSGGKKLFVVTCNEIRRLSDYLINRPGRFHYHFRFDYPEPPEIRLYMTDKLNPEYYDQIESVVSFSGKVKLNYDCLRAIAFELNHGISFKDAIADLNIVDTERESYTVFLYYKNGMVGKSLRVSLDMFGDEEEYVEINDQKGNNFVDVRFFPRNALFDNARFCHIIPGDMVRTEYFDSEDAAQKAKETEIDYLLIRREKDRDIHYAV